MQSNAPSNSWDTALSTRASRFTFRTFIAIGYFLAKKIAANGGLIIIVTLSASAGALVPIRHIIVTIDTRQSSPQSQTLNNNMQT
jgi:hypothetical protein